MTPTDLEQQIFDAWADATYPGDRHIGSDVERVLEAKHVEDFFRGRHWRAITLATLRDYRGDGSACLHFMTPEAVKFYLPAYMLIAINDYEQADVTAETAWRVLSPPRDPADSEWWLSRTVGFTSKQRQAILAFLRYFHEQHGDGYLPQSHAKSGLNGALEYWSAAV